MISNCIDLKQEMVLFEKPIENQTIELPLFEYLFVFDVHMLQVGVLKCLQCSWLLQWFDRNNEVLFKVGVCLYFVTVVKVVDDANVAT